MRGSKVAVAFARRVIGIGLKGTQGVRLRGLWRREKASCDPKRGPSIAGDDSTGAKS